MEIDFKKIKLKKNKKKKRGERGGALYKNNDTFLVIFRGRNYIH
jgi:hypothetical protein